MSHSQNKENLEDKGTKQNQDRDEILAQVFFKCIRHSRQALEKGRMGGGLGGGPSRERSS